MKGQTEIIVFILLFVIGVSLFLSAVVWSRTIFERNSDITTLNAAEAFMNTLDEKIQNIIRFGGKDSMNYNVDATIELVDSKTIELKRPLTVDISKEWINIKTDGSVIREKKEGNLLRIQLGYPEDGYAIYLYTDGPRIATPQRVLLEKGSSFEQGGKTFIRVKITFK